MKQESALRILTSLVTGFFFFGIYFLSPLFFAGLLVLILGYILIFEWPPLLEYKGWFTHRVSPAAISFTLIYPIFPVLCLLYLLYFYRDVHWFLSLYPFIVAWLFDSAAYIVGSLIGFHKLCPHISPGKSWEGTFAGWGALYLFHRTLFAHGRIFEALTLSTFVAMLALLGDLFESYLKRRVGLKDTGKILPGHGGFLDRFDSVFFVGVGIFILDRALRGGFLSLFW
jgi:phosphatidate cytidylyltransferase